MLLQQNIFMSEIFILHINYFNDLESFNFSRGKMIVVWLKDVFFFCCRSLISRGLLDLILLVGFPSSSLFISIFISQASSSPLLEEGEDMMPGLENSSRKQLQ